MDHISRRFSGTAGPSILLFILALGPLVSGCGIFGAGGSGNSSASPSAITSITPDNGPLDGTTSITIAGEGLGDATAVSIGGRLATLLSVVDDSQLICRTPSGVGIGPAVVDVTRATGALATQAAGFTYNAPPTMTSPVASGSGPLAGGTTLTSQGTNFFGLVSVTIGGQPATRRRRDRKHSDFDEHARHRGPGRGGRHRQLHREWVRPGGGCVRLQFTAFDNTRFPAWLPRAAEDLVQSMPG